MRATSPGDGNGAGTVRGAATCRRRQHASQLAGRAGERLEQVKPRDDEAIDGAARGSRVATDVRERLDVRGKRVAEALDDRDRQAGERRSPRPPWPPRGPMTTAVSESREHQNRGRDLPPHRVRQQRKRKGLHVIDGRERRGAPDARIDARPGQRPHERQRAVDVSLPGDLGARELLAVVRDEPRLTLAVAHLLPPVRADARAMVMPDERRRDELDSPALRLQPPAHVDVVAGAQIDRVEPADRTQGLAADRQVAAGHVLRSAIVEQHVGRPAGSARHAVRHPRTVERRKAESSRGDDF